MHPTWIDPKRHPMTPHVAAVVIKQIGHIDQSYNEKTYEVLLIERGRDPFKGKFAFPGGYVTPDESHDMRMSILRELEQTTGIIGSMAYFIGVRGKPERYQIFLCFPFHPLQGSSLPRSKYFL